MDNPNQPISPLPTLSIADLLERRRQEAEKRKADYEQKRQRATELFRQGYNPLVAYVESQKPVRDEQRELRANRAAKAAAWGNFLTALGTGIAGMATNGYVPKTGNDYPLRMLGKLNEWENLYAQQNREYQRLRLNMLIGQQQARQKAAQNEAAAAEQDYALARKQYDTLLSGTIGAEQRRQQRLEDFAQQKELARMRGDYSLRAAKARAETTALRADGSGSKKAIEFFDRDGETVIRLTPAQEADLLERGIKAGLIMRDGTPVRQPQSVTDKPPQFVYGRLSPAQKAALLRRVFIHVNYPQEDTTITGYLPGYANRQARYPVGPYSPEATAILETDEAEEMRRNGFSDQDIMEYYYDYE